VRVPLLQLEVISWKYGKRIGNMIDFFLSYKEYLGEAIDLN
jgi:hypothetical protein